MKNGPVNMRYSFGKTHGFQMELLFSISFSCFLTIPELDAFGPRGVAKLGLDVSPGFCKENFSAEYGLFPW